jgi:hypothetical protein
MKQSASGRPHWPMGRNGPLLDRARSLVASALSCGFTGLVMLHGLLTRSRVFAAGEWRPMARGPFALAHATYYTACWSLGSSARDWPLERAPDVPVRRAT